MATRKFVHKDYFEGILQLRNVCDELLDYVHHLIETSKEEVWVSKEKKVKGGIDLYVSSNKFLRRSAEKLKSRFFGQIKTSKNLFSRDRQSSKDIWRITVLFRLAPFKRNEEFMIRGVKMKVGHISEKVQLKEPESGKKHLLDYDEVVSYYNKSKS